MSKVYVFLLIVLMLTSITGCLPVNDFGQFWQQGFVEKNLDGTWVQDNNGFSPAFKISYAENESTIKIISFEANEPNTPPAKCKSLKLGKSTYLMAIADTNNPVRTADTSQPVVPSHFLVKYKIENNKLSFYSINIELLDKAIENKTIDTQKMFFGGEVENTMFVFNEKLCALLETADQQQDGWTEIAQYIKTDNIQTYLENRAKFIQQMQAQAAEIYKPGYKGKVIDENGSPVEGTKISLVLVKNLEGKNPDSDTQILAETVTDANGAFYIDYNQQPDANQPIDANQSYTMKLILAEKNGYSIAWHNLQFNDSSNIKMVVKKAELLQGVVKNLDGMAVSGAIVHAIPVSENEDSYYLENEMVGITKPFTAVTDGNGKFAISQMGKDQYYRFKIYVEGFYERAYVAKYRTDANNTITIREVIGVKLKFQEPQTGTVAKNLNFGIHGIVQPDKKEIWDSSSTNEQGIAELKLAPGDYTIEYTAAEKTEYGFYGQSFSVVKNKPLSLNIDTFRTGILEITVLNSDTGEPMEGVNISKNSNKISARTTGVGFSASTNQDGKAFVYLPEGEAVVENLYYNQTNMPVNLKCFVKAGETSAAELVFGAELSGVVKNRDGVVVPNAKVWIYPDSNNCVYTDSNGQFAISKSLIDKVQPQDSQPLRDIIVFITSQDTNQAAAFEYKIGESTRQIILNRAVIQKGIVKDSNGNPILGATVSIGILDHIGVFPVTILYQDEYTSQTDSDGKFEIPYIPESRLYYCKVSKDGYLPFSMKIGSISVVYKDEILYKNLEIRMRKISPQNRFAGYFGDIFCNNPAGVKMRLLSKSTNSDDCVTTAATDFVTTVDANGYYSFEGIERQNYELTYNLNDRGAVESNFPCGGYLKDIPATGDVNILASFYVGKISKPAKIPAGMGLLELEVLEADTNNTAFFSIAHIQKRGIANDITLEMKDSSKMYMLAKAGTLVIKSVEPSLETEKCYINTVLGKEILLKDGQITKEKIYIRASNKMKDN